jgi:hypothetical protein
MNATIVYTLVAASLLVINGLLFIGIAYRSAKRDRQFTFAPSGEIKFITDGESVSEVIANVPGKSYDSGKDIFTDGDPHIRWLIKKWGIVWVSWFYPIRRVHRYDFEYDELQAETDPTTKEVVYTMVHREYKDDKAVNSLYWRFQYPVLAREVELAGNFKIKVLVNVTFEVVKPVYLIFTLKGNWMPFATSAVIGFMEAYSKEKSFEQFRATASASSETEGSLAKELTDKLILAGAIRIVEAVFVTFDLTGSSAKIREANTDVEVAGLEAQATIKTAEGTKQKKILEGEGDAGAIRSKGTAEAEVLALALERGGPGAASVLAAREYAQAIAEAKPKFLTLGGNGPMASVPIEEGRAV